MRRIQCSASIVAMLLPAVGPGSVLAQSPYAAAVLADHPVAYWRLGEPAGSNNAADSSGSGLVAHGNARVLFGRPGALLNERATSVELTGSGSFFTGLAQRAVSQYSIELWIRTYASIGPVLQDRGITEDSVGGVGVSMTVGGGWQVALGSIFCGADGTQLWAGGATKVRINNGQWHHVACVFSGTPGVVVSPQQFSIYVDGEIQPLNYYHTSASTTAPLTGMDGTTIGSHPLWRSQYGVNNWLGLIEEVAVYDYALTADRVLAHYRASGR